MRKLNVHALAALTRAAIQQGITSLNDCLNEQNWPKPRFSGPVRCAFHRWPVGAGG